MRTLRRARVLLATFTFHCFAAKQLTTARTPCELFLVSLASTFGEPEGAAFRYYSSRVLTAPAAFRQQDVDNLVGIGRRACASRDLPVNELS
jgi:hypothetical protein